MHQCPSGTRSSVAISDLRTSAQHDPREREQPEYRDRAAPLGRGAAPATGRRLGDRVGGRRLARSRLGLRRLDQFRRRSRAGLQRRWARRYTEGLSNTVGNADLDTPAPRFDVRHLERRTKAGRRDPDSGLGSFTEAGDDGHVQPRPGNGAVARVCRGGPVSSACPQTISRRFASGRSPDAGGVPLSPCGLVGYAVALGEVLPAPG